MEIGSALIFVLATLSFFLFFKSRKKRNLPPGPFRLPIIGNGKLVKQLAIKYGGLHNAFSKLIDRYSSDVILLRLGGENIVVVQNEQLFEEICSRDEFQGRPDSFFLRLRSMGTRNGITMVDGPLWVEQRAFAVREMRDLGLGKSRMEYLIQEEIQVLFSQLEEGGSSARIRKCFSTCVLNVLWGMVTGSRFKDSASLQNLINLMERRAKVFDMAGGLLNQFPWLRFIPPERANYELINTLNRSFKDLILGTIDDHRQTYNKDETRSYIDAFLHEMNKNATDSFFTEHQLVMVCLDFFIGGSQTTSSTLDFVLLHMIRNPDIQKKAQEELDSVLSPNQVVSISDKPKLPYIQAIILESQRIHLVAPVIGPRRVLKDTKLGGFDIPKGYTVLLNLIIHTQDPKKWDQPEKFIPERFKDEKSRELFERKGFVFGRGKRRCPGEALAKSFLFILVANVLHRYKVDVVGDELPSDIPIPGITLSPRPYDIKLTIRHETRS